MSGPSDIGILSTVTTATLTDVWLVLAFQTPTVSSLMSAHLTPEISTALVDAALRDLINRRPVRLLPGIKRQHKYRANLQAAFPALFAPARAKAIRDRVRLIENISRSVERCRKPPQRQSEARGQITGAAGSSQDPFRHDEPVTQQSVSDLKTRHRLFAAMIHNTGTAQRDKRLKSLTVAHTSASMAENVSELPSLTDHLSLFDHLPAASVLGQQDLLLNELEDVAETGYGRGLAPGEAIYAEPTRSACSTPLLEELYSSQDMEATIVDYIWETEIFSASGASPTFSSMSPGAHSQLETDVSMLSQPANIYGESLSAQTSGGSCVWSMIGEKGNELTHSFISPDQPNSNRFSYLHVETPDTVTTFADGIFDTDIGDDLLKYELFASRDVAMKEPPRPLSTPTFAFRKLPDATKRHSACFEDENLLQDLDFAMGPTIDACPSLAELLQDEKFDRDMWARRRSRAFVPSPQIYREGANDYLKGGGRGWSFKSRSSDVQQTESPPLAACAEEGSASTADQQYVGSYFSKHSSSVSPSSSAQQSPRDIKMPRRGSLLRNLSNRSKSISEQEILDFNLSRLDDRVVDVKRRKTVADYEGREPKENEDDEMLFT